MAAEAPPRQDRTSAGPVTPNTEQPTTERSSAAPPDDQTLLELAATDPQAFERRIEAILRLPGEPLARKTAALRAVVAGGQPATRRLAFDLAWRDPASELRDFAVRLLSQHVASDDLAREILLSCSRRSDLDAPLRSRAIHGALRALPGPQLAAQAAYLLAEADEGVIGMAAVALRTNPAPEALQLLRDLAALHRSPAARQQAASALAQARAGSSEPMGR